MDKIKISRTILFCLFLFLTSDIIRECEGNTEIRSVSFDPKEGVPGKPLCVNTKYNIARNRSLVEISFETYTAKIFSYGKSGSLFYTNSTWGNRTDRINTKQNRFCFREVLKSDNNVPFRWTLKDNWNSQAQYVFTLPITIYPDHPPHIIFFYGEYEYDINYVVNVACYLEKVKPYPSMSFFLDDIELEPPIVSRTEVLLSDDNQYYDVQKRLTFIITEEMWLSHDNDKKPLTISCRSAFGQYNKSSSITVKLREYVRPPPPPGVDREYESPDYPLVDEYEDVSIFTKRPATSPPATRPPAPTRAPPATRPPQTRAPPATRPPPPTRAPPPTLAPTRPPPRTQPPTQPPRRVIVPTTTTTEEPADYNYDAYDYEYRTER